MLARCASKLISFFHRIWPMAIIAIGVIATAAWTGLLGYGLFRLGKLAL